MGADFEAVSLAVAAFKLLAVKVAVKVDVCGVAFLSLTVNINKAGVTLAVSIDLSLDHLVGDSCIALLCAQALVLAEGDHGEQVDIKCEDEGLVIGDLNISHAGSADHLKAAVVDAVAECIGSCDFDSILIESVCAVHALNDCTGSLALSEAGDIYTALDIVKGFVDSLVKLGRINFNLKSCSIIFVFFYVSYLHLCLPPNNVLSNT